MSNDRHNEFVTIDDLPENEQIALWSAIVGDPVLTLPSEFDHFDPINGEAPYELRNVVRRARALLKAMNRDQIRRAVEFAEFATAQDPIVFRNPDHLVSDEEAAAYSGDFSELRPSALFRRLKLLNQLGMKPKDLPWYVVFASLSLAYVARSVNNGVNHGIEASEALAKAEHLSAKSTAGRNKPVVAHFKQLLSEYIQENPGLSGRKYSEKFRTLYRAEMKNLHGKVYGERVVAEWALAIKRAQNNKK